MMDIIKLYKKENDVRTFNSIKYYVISMVLDILARKMVVNCITKTDEVEMSFNDIMQEIWKNSTPEMKWALPVARIQLIVSEMSWMNLIVNTGETSKNPNIKLTDEGFSAYKDQRFHSIAATLMEAKESRRLSIIAIAISIITLIVTAISIIFN